MPDGYIAVCRVCGCALKWDDWKGSSWTGAFVDANGVEHPLARMLDGLLGGDGGGDRLARRPIGD